jgi:hypothetical protein
MLKRRPSMALVLLLALFAIAPALGAAEPAAQGGCDPAANVFAADTLGFPMLAVQGEVPETGIGNPGEQSVCNAQCWDGSYVSCWGTSCTARDSSCSSGHRGYCYGSSTGYRYCPPCPCASQCSASTTCANGSTVSCSGCSGDCYSIKNCYAYCDGVYHWCPNPPLCPV